MNCEINKFIGIFLKFFVQCGLNKCILVCSWGLLGLAGWMLLIQECSLKLWLLKIVEVFDEFFNGKLVWFGSCSLILIVCAKISTVIWITGGVLIHRGQFGEKWVQMKERVGSRCAQAEDIPEDLPSTSSGVQICGELNRVWYCKVLSYQVQKVNYFKISFPK